MPAAGSALVGLPRSLFRGGGAVAGAGAGCCYYTRSCFLAAPTCSACQCHGPQRWFSTRQWVRRRFCSCCCCAKGKTALAKHVREFIRKSEHGAVSVSTEAQSVPVPTIRTLARRVSDPSEDASKQEQRQLVWTRARESRKKVVEITVARTKDQLAAAVGTLTKGFQPVLKESHRGFFLSADLMQENGETPWKNLTKYRQEDMQPHLDFLTALPCGPADFLFLFDGRSREARRVLEAALAKVERPVEELWVTYFGGLQANRAGKSRRVPLSSCHREVGYVVFPCPRTRFEVKPRDKFNVCGETSTTFGTYSGVPPRRLPHLPRVACPADKAALLGVSLPAEPPSGEGAAAALTKVMPLFWQEAKSADFFLQLIQDFDLKCVVDISPGSGALAEACLTGHVGYVGLCKTEAHSQWLQNVMDRGVLPHIVRSGGPLYQADLGGLIQLHYRDVLEAIEAADEAAEPEDDDDDEGAETVGED